MDDLVVEGGQVARQFQRGRRPHAMADVAFRIIKIRLIAGFVKHGTQRIAFLYVAGGRARRVGVHDMDVLRLQARPFDGAADAFRLSFRIRQHRVTGVRIVAPSGDFAVDLRATRLRTVKPFQNNHRAAFGDYDAVAVAIERTARLRRILMMGQRRLVGERREDSKRVRTFGNTAGQRHIHFSQKDLLHALNDTEIARRARRANRVVRSCDAKIDRHFARRIVRDGSRIVVVRPIFRIVVVLADLIDLPFRLDVAVLRDADEHARPILRVVAPKLDARVRQRFAHAVDGNRASPCSNSYLLAFLVFRRIIRAQAGERVAEIADVVRHDAGHAVQQIRAEFAQGVAVRRRQPYSCDDNAFLIVLHDRFSSICHFTIIKGII